MGASPSSMNYVATYEIASPGGGYSAPNYSAPYEGLLYQGWGGGPFDEAGGDCAYVCAASFPAEAAFQSGSGVTANMTSDYSGSNVTHFTVSDFYWGCNGIFTNFTYQGQSRPLESPVNCSLSVAAYTSPQKAAVAKQTFQYKPNIQFARNTGGPAALMNHVELPSAFKATGIKYLKFTATGPPTGYASAQGGVVEGPFAQGPPDVLLDNFNYTVYYT